MPVPFEETRYGFRWGSLEVERLVSDYRGRGTVMIGVKSPRHRVEVYGTRTGQVRVWLDGKEMKEVPDA